jgi:ubiquinone/menaquinone biosynthesis C-methylase UbiE
MENILRSLGPSHTVLDLGCGESSFRYSNYECRVIGVDVVLNAARVDRGSPRFQYVLATSTQLPIAPACVDAVICNHTMEHFEDYKKVLAEIGRVLRPAGLLWISVPNGHGFDDTLYRFVYRGGGHVNRFTFDALVRDVEAAAAVRLVQAIELFSGFVYLHSSVIRHTMNVITRMLDRHAGLRTSRYGWGFVFARGACDLPLLPPSYFNVCGGCGAGQGLNELVERGRVEKSFGIPIYRCVNCGCRNVLFKPMHGLS